MKLKQAAFEKQYQSILGKYLQSRSDPGLGVARKLGVRALALGLATLDLAKIHETALFALLITRDSDHVRNGLIRRGVTFFTEAITPIEEAHRGALEANLHLKAMLATLTERTRELALSRKELEREIRKCRIAENSLRISEKSTRQLLMKSQDMQEEMRLLSRRLFSVQEEERKRISRELHDVVAQTLTGINVQLSSLTMQSTEDAESLQTKITSTQRLVENSVAIVHRFARDLRPTVLDDLGLVPAIRSYLKLFTQQSGIAVEFVASMPNDELSADHRTALYRVMQEAVTNISRHAEASQGRVSLKKLGASVCLEIRDDGLGFPEIEQGVEIAKRLGLVGMRERIEMVGGRFSVKSQPGKGTNVRVTIPQAGTKHSKRKKIKL